MKKFFILAALMLSCYIIIAQIASSAYTVMTGKISGMDATLHLHLAGNKASGFLWFNSTPKPMQCYASFNTNRDSLTISAHSNPLSITLKGKLTSNAFSGESTIEKETANANGKNGNSRRASFNLNTTTTGFTAFDYVYTTGRAIMPPQLKNESTAEYSAATVWPKSTVSKSLATTLKWYVNREFGNKGNIKEPGKIFITDRNAFINDWKSEMAKVTTAEARQMGLSLSHQTEESINVMYEDAKIITLCHFNYEFTGGAHGNYGSSISNFNKKTGAIIKLTDVLTKEGIEKLPLLLEASLRVQFAFDKNKTLEQNGLFVRRMEPSDNFYIANNAIGFVYSTYELLPYSYGEPNIFIPATSVQQYLKAPYKN